MKSKIIATMLITMLMLTPIAFAYGNSDGYADSDYRDTQYDRPERRGGTHLGLFDSPNYRPLYVDRDDSNFSDKLRERLKYAKEKYELRQDRYGELRDNYHNARQNATEFFSRFQNIRTRFQEASGEDRDNFASELRSNSQSVLLHQVIAILHRLEAIKDNENAPENIEELIEFFEEKRIELEGEELTQEEIHQISKEIREFWKNKIHPLKKRIGEKLNAHIKGIISKAEAFSDRISSLIERLNDRGKDTSKLESGLEKLNSDIDRFNIAYDKVKEALREAETREDVEQVLKKAHNLLRAMNKQLIKDFNLMKALFKATRELNEGEITSETIEELDETLKEPTKELDMAIEELEAVL